MKRRFEGKGALTTAGAQGMGEPIARTFVDAGATVVAPDINAEKLAELDSVNGIDVLGTGAIASLIDRGSHCDVLFSCAGFIRSGSVLECTHDGPDMGLDLNVKSMFPINKTKIAHIAVNLARDESIFMSNTLMKVDRGMSI